MVKEFAVSGWAYQGGDLAVGEVAPAVLTSVCPDDAGYLALPGGEVLVVEDALRHFAESRGVGEDWMWFGHKNTPELMSIQLLWFLPPSA